MKYLSTEDLCERYQVHVCTIWRWVKKNSFPKPQKLAGSLNRWKLEDIEAWEAEQ